MFKPATPKMKQTTTCDTTPFNTNTALMVDSMMIGSSRSSSNKHEKNKKNDALLSKHHWNTNDSMDFRFHIHHHSSTRDQHDSDSSLLDVLNVKEGEKPHRRDEDDDDDDDEASTSSSRKTKNIRKVSKGSKVSFYTRVKVIRVSKRNSIPEFLAGHIWYTDDEFREMKKDCIRTIRVMLEDEDENYYFCDGNNGTISEGDNDDICFRGLEYRAGCIKQAQQRRKKEQFRRIILDTQKNVRNHPDSLAELSRKFSAKSVENAIKAAERDHSQSYDDWRYHFFSDQEEEEDDDDLLDSNQRKSLQNILCFPKLKLGMLSNLSTQVRSKIRN